ncbi:MAG: hypothetical protein WCR06_03920 [bacterium]
MQAEALRWDMPSTRNWPESGQRKAVPTQPERNIPPPIAVPISKLHPWLALLLHDRRDDKVKRPQQNSAVVVIIKQFVPTSGPYPRACGLPAGSLSEVEGA